MYETLTWYEDAKVVPQLATSWKTIDERTWEFKLRSGVKFHNGEDFNADAVKFTLDRIIDPKRRATQAGRFAALKSVDVVDAETVRFNMSAATPVLPISLNQVFIEPPQYTTQSPEKAVSEPIGTGPFKFESWQQGAHMNFVANTSYWGGRPNLDKLVFRVIVDDTARLAALKSGDVHAIMNLPFDAIDAVATDPKLKVLSAFTQKSLIFEMDTLRGGPTANAKVRMAINYAIDKDAINNTIMRGKLRPLAGQLFTEELLGWNPDLKQIPYDPNRARQLLEEAGFPDGFDTVINGPIGKYTGDRDMVIAIAEQLNKVGIRAKANPMEYGLFIKKILADEAGPMFLLGYASFGDPASITVHFSSRSTFGHYYEDETYDELEAEAASALNEEARHEIYLRLQQHMHDQAMAVWLFQAATYYGISDRVTGFEASPDDVPVFNSSAIEA